MGKKKPKYLSKKQIIDGIEFDSKKEASRYAELKTLERSGKIKGLRMQVPYALIPAQYEEVKYYTPKTHQEKKKKHIIEREVKYIADFVYEKDGEIVVEDVKGYRKSSAYSIFVLKRKMMLYFHNIRIREI